MIYISLWSILNASVDDHRGDLLCYNQSQNFIDIVANSFARWTGSTLTHSMGGRIFVNNKYKVCDLMDDYMTTACTRDANLIV